MKQVIDTIELLSSAHITGEAVAQALRAAGDCEVEVTPLERDGAATEFLSIVIPGADPPRRNWASSAAWAASARPAVTGLVSDSDGAVVAIAAALKIMAMARQGDVLPAPCASAPTSARAPAPVRTIPCR